MGHLVNSGSSRLGSVCALVVGLGAAFACAVEDNLPIGDWVGAGAAGAPGSGGSGTGGSAGAGGSGVGTTAGSGGTMAGSGGTTAGSGGTTAAGLLNVGCDYVTALNSSCSRSGCHNERSQIATLDLSPRDAEALIGRLKDQPATHSEIDCGNGGIYVECVPESCPAPGSALLVDSANPEASWILQKINGTQNGCGFQMPMPPGDIGFDDARRACIENLVLAIANVGGDPPDCFSPTNLPDPSGSTEQVGCECSGSAALCVVREDGHEFALMCDEGRWWSAEDGPCDPGSGTRCQVRGEDFTQIVKPGTAVKSPFSICNTCTCGDSGTLEQCTPNDCADRQCPAGTAPGERCVACGLLPGGCDVLETGCLEICESSEDCGSDAPNCVNGVCAIGPCF